MKYAIYLCFFILFIFSLAAEVILFALEMPDTKLEESRVIIAKSSDPDELARTYLEIGVITSFSPNHNHQEGITALQKVISEYSQSRWADDALWYMGKAYLFSLHNESEAISTYQKALDEYKGIKLEKWQEMKKPPDYITPEMLKQEIDRLKAVSKQRDELESQIKSVTDPQKAVELFSTLAEAYRNLANFPQATKTYQQIIQQSPTQNLAAKAQFESGEVYFKDQVAFYDSLYYPPFGLLKQSLYEEAIKCYQGLLDKYPESELVPQAMYRIGESYFQLKEYAKAKDTFDRLVNEYPKSPLVAKARELSTKAENETRSNTAKVGYGRYYAVVEKFCQAWQNKDYETMYDCLSQESRETKDDFVKRYKGYEAKGGQLAEYTLFPPIAGGDGAVIVRVSLRFSTDVLPEIVSGVNRFDVVEEEGNWGVKKMRVPTLPSPLLGLPSSHPGEN